MLRYALLATLAGCLDPIAFPEGGTLNIFPPVGTSGSFGNVLFAYDEGCQPNFLSAVCALDSGAILAGGAARIEIEGQVNTLPALTATSSDSSVFEVGSVETDGVRAFVRVTARAPGRAMLSVNTVDGVAYDIVGLAVENAATLAFTDAAPTLLLGSPESIPVIARDANGKQLFGRGAFAFDAGSLAVHTDYGHAADLMFVGTDHAVVSGGTVGVAPVSAHLGALAALANVSIVDASAVAKIVPSELGILVFESETAAGAEVRGAHCVPSVSAAFEVATRFLPEGVVPGLVPGDEIVVDSTGHGPAVVSCAIGAVVGSVALTF